jgi:hypothetical protein
LVFYFSRIFTFKSNNLWILSLLALAGSVLEGLAKFAHVINLEFFSGLIAALQDLLASGFLQHRSVLRSNLASAVDPDPE